MNRQEAIDKINRLVESKRDSYGNISIPNTIECLLEVMGIVGEGADERFLVVEARLDAIEELVQRIVLLEKAEHRTVIATGGVPHLWKAD